MVAQFWEYTKYHWHIHVQGVYCMICKLYYNKVVKIDISKQINYITFRFMSDIPIIPKLLWKWLSPVNAGMWCRGMITVLLVW